MSELCHSNIIMARQLTVSVIVQCMMFMMNLVPTGQYKLSVDILLYLTKVPRFEMNAMFLGPIEKEGIYIGETAVILLV